MCQLGLYCGASGWHGCSSPRLPQHTGTVEKMSGIPITYFSFITCGLMLMNVAAICIWNKEKWMWWWWCADRVSMDLLLYCAFYLTKSSAFIWGSPDTPQHFNLANMFIYLLSLFWLIITSLCDQWNWKQIIQKRNLCSQSHFFSQHVCLLKSLKILSISTNICIETKDSSTKRKRHIDPSLLLVKKSKYRIGPS